MVGACGHLTRLRYFVAVCVTIPARWSLMPDDVEQSDVSWSAGRLLKQAALPFAVGVVAGIVAIIAAGPTLGAFFGATVLAALLVPGIALSATRPGAVLMRAGGLVDGVGLAWLWLMFAAEIGFRQWLGAYVVLVALLSLLVGLAWALRRLGASAGVSAGISAMLGILWLSCPVWLFHHLSSMGADWLVRGIVAVHPLFALNGLLDLGNWTEMGRAYHLLQLNQDVPIALPAAIWASVAVHGVVGVTLWGAAAKFRGQPPIGATRR